MKSPIAKVLLFLVLYQLIALVLINQYHYSPEDYSKKSLSILDYWNRNSLLKSHLIPTYLENDSAKMYLAHPPLAYYTLYAFNKLFGFKSFYVLNSLLVVISAFFVYLTICLLTLKKARTETSIFAWLGMILFLTSFPILRFQLLNFHPDIFVLPFLIIAQYLFLKLLMKERYRSLKYLFLIGLSLALLCYSSWFGAVFNFIVVLMAMINLRKGYKLVPYILIATLITISITMLIYGQYSIYGGWKNVIFYFKDTYLRESPFYGHIRQSGWQIILQIIRNLGVLIFTLVLFIGYSFKAKKRKFLFTKNGYRYLILSILPVLVYSILLVHYFQNTFASLYFVAPIIACIAVWLEKLFRNEKSSSTFLKIVSFILITNLSLFLIL